MSTNYYLPAFDLVPPEHIGKTYSSGGGNVGWIWEHRSGDVNEARDHWGQRLAGTSRVLNEYGESFTGANLLETISACSPVTCVDVAFS